MAALIGLLALALGGWAYRHREFTLHDSHLRRLITKSPPAAEVRAVILADNGNWPMDPPAADRELYAFAARFMVPQRAHEVVQKSHRWASLQVFGVRSVVYFLYFDEKGLLRDYVLGVSQSARPPDDKAL